MALEGTFQDFGLADIFQLVGLQKKTGVMTVRGEEGRLVTVSFEKGMVVFADEFKRSEAERLGSVLLRTRRLTQEQLDQAVALQKSTAQRLGHVLISLKFVSRGDLSQALQLQVKETVYRLFRWQGGSYHFSSEPVTFDREIYLPLPAEFVLMEGTRMIDEWPMLEKKIPNFQMVFALVPGNAAARPLAAPSGKDDLEDLISIVDDDEPAAAAGASFDRVGEALGPREKAVLALVNGVRTVQEIIDLSRLGDFETCKVLHGLLSLNLVLVRDSGSPAPAVRVTKPKRGAGNLRQYGMIAAVVALFLAAFLFNPWGFVAQGFRAGQGRLEADALTDAVRMRRVRLALEVFFLEKQAYPSDLAKLAESGLMRERDLRAYGGAHFVYTGGESGYQLEREAGR